MSSLNKRELIAGPFRPALEDALAGRIRAIKETDPGAPVLVLVGSFVLKMYLARRMAEQVPLWNVRFLDFRELTDRLAQSALGTDSRRPLPAAAARLLVGEIAAKERSGYFDRVADLPGFAAAAAETIRDLKDAGLDSSALDHLSGRKAEALKRIFGRYERALKKHKRCDDADLLALAAERAAESDFLRGSHFVAYGFYDLTGLQRRLVRAAASAAGSAAAMVPSSDAPAFEYARPLLEWFRGDGFVEAAAVQDAESIAARLFTPPAGRPANDGRFSVLSAPGESREVREVVRQVLAFAEQGVPFHEIGVLLRTRDPHSRPLRDAFERSGIPCFSAGGTPLAETREARALLMLADLLAGELPRADVMEFVHFAPFDFEELVEGTPNTPAWDLLTIEAGIVGGVRDWQRRLDRLDATERGDELSTLKTFASKLLDAKKSVPQTGTWADIIGALLKVADAFFVESETQARVREEVEALAELDDVGVGATFDLVREAVRDTLERAAVSSAGFQRGKVFVGELEKSRGLGFRAVIIPGLVEKGFPQVGRQDPILLDAERHVLAAKAGPDAYLPAKGGRVAEERMLFALAVGAGSEHVALTFPRLDVTTARERVPSHFLPRLVEALTGERCDHATLQAADCFVRVPAFPGSGDAGPSVDVDEYDLCRVASLIAKRGQAGRALYLAELSEQFGRGVAVERARWQEPCFTAYDGLAAAANETVDGPVSPTRLEEYADCPFRYFLHRVLRVEALEEPEAVVRLPALDRGSLLHGIFYTAYSGIAAGGGEFSADALARALTAAAKAAFKRRRAAVPPLTWALDQAEMLADLNLFAALDAADLAGAGARPALFEARFGMPSRDDEEDAASTEEPVRVPSGGTDYLFKGRIDRIDEVGSDSARVIDYKTGRASGKDDTFNGGRALQLPIYLLAAETFLPGRSVDAAEYSYATGRGEFSRVAFSRKALESRRGEFDTIIDTIVSHIERGVFVATPDGDNGRCQYCDLRAACSVNRDVLFERKKDDPLIKGLLDMAEIE